MSDVLGSYDLLVMRESADTLDNSSTFDIPHTDDTEILYDAVQQIEYGILFQFRLINVTQELNILTLIDDHNSTVLRIAGTTHGLYCTLLVRDQTQNVVFYLTDVDTSEWMHAALSVTDSVIGLYINCCLKEEVLLADRDLLRESYVDDTIRYRTFFDIMDVNIALYDIVVLVVL